MLERMSEMLFVEVLRRHVDSLPAEQTGWLAGMRDPAVGRALSLIHEKPAEAWTLERLSEEAGLSRSSLHERFVHFIGQPPMQYLTQWRMQVASGLLRDTNAKLVEVALDVGYESEAAFSRAFKRVAGLSPGAWRKESGGARGRSETRRQEPARSVNPWQLLRARKARRGHVRRARLGATICGRRLGYFRLRLAARGVRGVGQEENREGRQAKCAKTSGSKPGQVPRFRGPGRLEFVDRPGISGIIGIVAVTPDGRLLLVEQHRSPVDAPVLELPAGLVGARAKGGKPGRGRAPGAREETGSKPRLEGGRSRLSSRAPRARS